MQRVLLAASLLGIAVISFVPDAGAHVRADVGGQTPASCDGMTLSHHVHRARALIRHAYALDRWEDATPAKRSELEAYRRHKFCILLPHERRALGRYRERMAERFDEHVEEQQWLAALTPPGPEWLAALRYCESGSDGLYLANTGNGFYGAYQFTLSTWASVGGSGYPHEASPAEQDYRAALLYRTGGPGHWPNCP